MLTILSPLQVGYASVFLVAAIGCAVGLHRARRINHSDTRRGLVGLLLISGSWAFIQSLQLLVSADGLKIALELLGLVVGLASIGAWLYFCSACTGQSYHQNPIYRRIAVGVFFALSAVKLTNPIHGLYVSIRIVAEPFRHVILIPTPLHWSVVGLMYVLSAIGFYMLFQLLDRTRYETLQLGVLVSLAGLPALATIVSYAGVGPFLQMDYEPIGVAVFAIGTLYITEDLFQAVQHHGRIHALDELDEAVLLMDDELRLQDYNSTARDLLPAVSGTVQGRQLSALLPEVASVIGNSQRVIDREVDDERKHFAVSDTVVSLGPHKVGRAVILTDVTEATRQRRELSLYEDQMDNFVAGLTHELRNALTIVQGQLDVTDTAIDDHRLNAAQNRLEKIESATDRMHRVINDLVILAQQGRVVRSMEHCDLASTLTEAPTLSDSSQLSVTIGNGGTIEADRSRLVRLFAQAFQFASANGASEVHINLTASGFVIEDDGEPLPDGGSDDLFEYGKAVPDAERGGILPPIRTLARVHGWTVSVDTTYQDGIRYRVTDVIVDLSERATS
jgi:signal transduction histidine kinase